MQDDDLRKTIDMPVTSKLEEVTRTALVQFASVGIGPFASVIDKVVPSNNGAEQKRWQSEITERSNRLGEIVADLRDTGKVTLRGSPAQIAIYVAQSSPAGMPDRWLDVALLQAKLPGTPIDEIQDGIAELERHGLVISFSTMQGIASFLPSPVFFEIIDPVVMGIHVRNYAAKLAQVILDGQGRRDGAAQLHAEVGWPIRIFNPAFGRIVRLMPKITVSRIRDQTYVATRIQSRLAECRLILKRIAAEYEPDLDA